MTDSQKAAVELLVDEDGLQEAEARIKSQTDQHSNERYALLSHARKVADRVEVEA